MENQSAGSKKTFIPLQSVNDFIDSLSVVGQGEVWRITDVLEADGMLSAPFGEKVEAGMFAMRILKAGNARIFYVYGHGDIIYGVHAYFKKTESIPLHELRQARRAALTLKNRGCI